MKHTAATKRKLSALRRGALNPFFGRTHTQEFKDALAERNKVLNAKRQYVIGPRTVRDLNDLEASYLAGIIDGEGCITLPAGRKGVVLTIGNSGIGLIRWLEKIGNRKAYKQNMDRQARIRNRVQFYVWTVYGTRDLIYLLERTRPFMTIKGKRCDEALKILRAKLGDR